MVILLEIVRTKIGPSAGTVHQIVRIENTARVRVLVIMHRF